MKPHKKHALRKPQATREESAARVDAIASMMRALTFRRGVTVRELAAQWGLAVDTVERLSAEASRRVRAEMRSPDEVRDLLQGALEQVIDRALADDDRRSVIDAARALGPIVGAQAPVRVDVTAQPLPATRAELLAEAIALSGEISRQLTEGSEGS